MSNPEIIRGFDPENKESIGSLRESVEWSSRKLNVFRKTRIMAIKEFVGKYYSDEAYKEKVPVNFLELVVTIYMRQLIARTPQCAITTDYKQLKPFALTFELAENHLIKEIDLKSTIEMVVMDAMFCIGITKTGLTPSGRVMEVDGYLHDPGQPYCDYVDIDDWVQDMTAKRWENVQYCGNKYMLNYEFVKTSGEFMNVDGLNPTVIGDRSSLKQHSEGEAADLTRGTKSNIVHFQEQIELLDLWVPYYNVMITLPAEPQSPNGEDLPLKVVEWDGPETGPYDTLSFTKVPGNVMPLAPVFNLMDLHDLANRLFRKLGRQAERQKTVTGYQGTSEQDASRIMEASDGEMVRMDNPQGVNEFNFGGPNNITLAFMLQIKDLFSWFSGNLDSLGGLSPMAETLGQDELLAKSASQKIAHMQDKTIEFTEKICSKLAFYLWNDPLINLPLVKRIPGINIDIPTTFSAEQREGDFLDYNFTIKPFSMREESPSQKLQTIMQITQNFIIPMMPIMQQQGVMLNFKELMSIITRYGNVPELDEILMFADGQGLINKPGPIGEMPFKMPANTTRTYERVNRPGASRAGKDSALFQALVSGIGQGQQPAQRAQMMGGVS